MTGDDGFVNIEAYITSLMGARSSEYPDQYHCEETIAENDYEEFVDDVYSAYERSDLRPGCAVQKYLAFEVDSTGYVVPVNRIMRTKWFHNDQRLLSDDIDLYEARELISNDCARPGQRQYVIIIKGRMEYALLADTVNGIVEIDDDQVRLKRTSDQRSWLAGMSRDYQYFLLDADNLGDILMKSSKYLHNGTNPAVQL